MAEPTRDRLEARTGHKTLWANVLDEPLPGGARWRYVFGPALAATFLIQLLTGLLLMSSYVPSASQAWGSVWYIQTQMVLGWFVRGLHHFGSSAMMVLLLLHLVQVIVTAAYRTPREVNWWLGLGLMALVLGLALTGYLLPWDQKGYWATRVATNIAGSTPFVGPYVLKVLVGGGDYGNQTLTRLFSLHVGFLPLVILALLAVHVRLYYRHGVSAPEHARGEEPAWPGQVVRNLSAVALVLGILVGVTLWFHGANLEAPADPTNSEYPARPEWYFLALFQMLNHFESPYEVIGTHILPGVLFLFLALLPLLDRALPRRLMYATACLVLASVVGVAGYLMTEAVLADRANPSFQLARAAADTGRERALQLAGVEGVPPDGAIYLLRRDPLTHGREVLERYCLSCHYYGGRGRPTRLEMAVTAADLARVGKATPLGGLPEVAARAVKAMLPAFVPSGSARPVQALGPIAAYEITGTRSKGEPVDLTVTADGRSITSVVWSRQTASDLNGFGTRAWVRGLLEDPGAPAYFGATPNLKGMKTWKSGQGKKYSARQLDTLADFVAELGEVLEDETPEEWYDRVGERLPKHPGYPSFVKDCGRCHLVGEAGLVTEGGLMDAPGLFAYGPKRWLMRMIENPGHPDLYGYLDEPDRMPAFEGRLSSNDFDMLVRFLRGDYLPAPGPIRRPLPGLPGG